jgi:hypothetical protein
MKTLCLFLLVLTPLPAAGPEAVVPLKERMWIGSRIYAAVQKYFGHWQAVPGLNFDNIYRNYIEKIAATEDRIAFDLATMELLASLRNGHSDFDDPGFGESRTTGRFLARFDRRQIDSARLCRRSRAGCNRLRHRRRRPRGISSGSA